MQQAPSTATFMCREALPDIDISVHDDARLVVDVIASLAGVDTSLIVERHYELFGEKNWYIVNLRSLRPSPHEEGGGQLIARPDRPGRIQVEMRAALWCPDPPTREVYVTAARELFGPFLRTYNQMHARSYRLRVARPRKLGSSVSPKTRVLIERFAILANQNSLHALDWGRFYRIVKESRREAAMEDVRALLIEHGFTPKRAGELAEIYEHLWAYKNRS